MWVLDGSGELGGGETLIFVYAQKTAYEVGLSCVGSEIGIRDSS